jgi:hypothetical protein
MRIPEPRAEVEKGAVAMLVDGVQEAAIKALDVLGAELTGRASCPFGPNHGKRLLFSTFSTKISHFEEPWPRRRSKSSETIDPPDHE